MRVAILFRGITYCENYIHKYNLPQYTIDFRDTFPSIQQNLIDPFVETGHTVDTFVLTYHSPLETEVVRAFKPKKISFMDYVQIPIGQAQEVLGEPLLINYYNQLLDMMTSYEDKEGFQYDFVIVTRPDLYFYQRVTDIQIDFTTVNMPFWHIARPHDAPAIFSSEDNWVGFPRDKVPLLLSIIGQLQQKSTDRSIHLIGKYFLDHGQSVKYLFGEKGDGAYDYPFYKFGRHIFGLVKNFNSIDENLRVPMNRIFHSETEAQQPAPIYKNSSATL